MSAPETDAPAHDPERCLTCNPDRKRQLPRRVGVLLTELLHRTADRAAAARTQAQIE